MSKRKTDYVTPDGTDADTCEPEDRKSPPNTEPESDEKSGGKSAKK